VTPLKPAKATCAAIAPTTRATAIEAAEVAANATGLPQTVLRNAGTCGWWHTHSLARVLAHSEVLVTILPSRYFC
jgi:uncharacterized protein YbjT (DUF2867 family)